MCRFLDDHVVSVVFTLYPLSRIKLSMSSASWKEGKSSTAMTTRIPWGWYVDTMFSTDMSPACACAQTMENNNWSTFLWLQSYVLRIVGVNELDSTLKKNENYRLKKRNSKATKTVNTGLSVKCDIHLAVNVLVRVPATVMHVGKCS